MTNILFTCAGRRNYLINYFKEALDGKGKIFAADMSSSAPAMVDADKAIIVPSIYDTTYITALKDVIVKNNINAVIPLNDLELPILSRNLEELSSTGAKIIVSNDYAIDIAFDKVKTFNFLIEIGLNSPKTLTSLSKAKEAITNREFKFPLVIKPRWGSASIGIDIVDSIEELELTFKYQHLKLKKSILNISSQKDIENAILIQEGMNGDEYGMDILNDFEGNYIGTFVRKKLSMRSGETDKAVSIIDKRFDVIGKMISEKLRHIGNIDCDVFIVDGELYVLELNPRFGGGYPFSHEAGINTAAIYIEWINERRDISQYINYKACNMFSKCDRLMRVPNTK